jgi:hypothetical protein
MDVVQGMVERIMKWGKEDMYHAPRFVREKLAITQKEKLVGMHICFAMFM